MSTATIPRSIWFTGTRGDVLVSSEETEGRLSIIETSGRRGEMPPLHVHHTDDEVFHVLEGELTLFHGDRVTPVRVGETALAPCGIPHAFRIESDFARWLVVTAPGGFDRFIAAIGVEAAGPGLPDEFVPPNLDAAAELEAETGYRIELLGPPGLLPGAEG
jgi:quercetin dioxygenase-like cupin family protein